MFCENCGAKIPDGASYCEQCGLPAVVDYGAGTGVEKPKSPIIWVIVSIASCVTILAITIIILFAMGILGEKDHVEQTATTQKGSIQGQTSEATEPPTATPAVTQPPVTHSPVTNPPIADEHDGWQDGEQRAEVDKDQYIEDEFIQVKMEDLQSVTATSSLSERGMVHSAKRICDGTLRRAWTEGVPGQGIGEGVTFTFDGEYAFSGMRINAGYQKSESLYYKNSRPKKIRLDFSDGSTVRVSLRDVYATQKVTFDECIIADEVTVIIESVYKGSKYSDTVISELIWF